MAYTPIIAGFLARSGGGGAPITPGGADGSIQYNNAGAFGGVTGLTTVAGVLSRVVVAGGTVVVSTPVISVSQTWNDGAVAFNGLDYSFTSTASAAVDIFSMSGGTNLVRWNLGGSTLAAITKDGRYKASLGYTVVNGVNRSIYMETVGGADGVLRLNSSGSISWSDSVDAGAGTSLSRQASGVIASSGFLRTATPNGGTSANWKFGSSITSGTSALDTSGYVELDIGGTLVKLARVTNS